MLLKHSRMSVHAARNGKRAPPHLASEVNVDIVQLLIQHVASGVKVKYRNHMAPLHRALFEGRAVPGREYVSTTAEPGWRQYVKQQQLLCP